MERVIGTVPSTNRRALKIDYQMGFQYVTKVPDVVPGGDMIVLSMSRAECKYLEAWLAICLGESGMTTHELFDPFAEHPVVNKHICFGSGGGNCGGGLPDGPGSHRAGLSPSTSRR